MPALKRKLKATRLAVEATAPLDEFSHPTWALGDDDANRLGLANAGPDRQRVFDVGGNRIFFTEDGGDPPWA